MEGNALITGGQHKVQLIDAQAKAKRAAAATVGLGVATAVATAALGILAAVFHVHHMRPKTMESLITAAQVVGIGGAVLTGASLVIYGSVKRKVSDLLAAGTKHATQPKEASFAPVPEKVEKEYERFFPLNDFPKPPQSDSDTDVLRYLSDLEYELDQNQDLKNYNWHIVTSKKVMHSFFDDYERQLQRALDEVKPYLEREGVKEEAHATKKAIENLQRGAKSMRERNDVTYQAFIDYMARTGMYADKTPEEEK